MISPRKSFNSLTVKQLREETSRLSIKVPSSTRKEGLVSLLCRYWRHWDIYENYTRQRAGKGYDYYGCKTLTPRQSRRFQKAANRSLGTTGIRRGK